MPNLHHNHSKCIANLLTRAEKTCGARFTTQRKSVLACIAQSHVAVGAYDVIERMAVAGRRPAPITIYRAIDFLLEHQLVHKIESRNSFVACAGTHSDAAPTLLICEDCGTVEEIIQTAAAENLSQAAVTAGFKVNRAVIELSGTCKSCTDV